MLHKYRASQVSTLLLTLSRNIDYCYTENQMFSMEKSSKFQSCNVHTKYNKEEVVGSLRKKIHAHCICVFERLNCA